MQRLAGVCLLAQFVASRAETLSPSFPGTTLITNAHAGFLFSWGVPEDLSWHICYKSSRADGFSTSAFHNGCDNQGRTVTVARVGVGSVQKLLGGFTAATWAGSGSWAVDPQAFLFSLTNSYKHAQVSSSNHIYRLPTYFQTFGGNFHHDLYLGGTGGPGSCYLGSTYGCRMGSPRSEECRIDFCGTANHFDIEELEVFRQGPATTYTMTSTTITATASRTTTSSTFSSTTSTMQSSTVTATNSSILCQAGYYASGAFCLQCQAGTHSRPGGDCLPTLQQALSWLGSPDVNVSSHGQGVVQMRISLPTVPAETFEGFLSFHVDMKPEAEQMSAEGPCDLKFSRSPAASSLEATFVYSQLRGPCSLSVRVNDTHVLWHGVVGLFLTLDEDDSPNRTVVVPWIFPVRVDMSREAAVWLPLHIWQPIWMPEKPPTHAGQFVSSLHFFNTNLFDTERTRLIYHDGDTSWIEHRLLDEAMAMEVKWVVLSKNIEVTGPVPTAENLTETMLVVESSGGRVRFGVHLHGCVSCYLHVWSHVTINQRRLFPDPIERHLMSVAHYAYHKAAFVVYPRGDPNVLRVQLIVPPPYALVISLVAATSCGGISRLLTWRTTRCRRATRKVNKFMFFWLELLDVGLDILAYRFCAAEGDLDMDDDGWSATALLSSVVASVALFVLELAVLLLVLLLKKDWLDDALPWLIPFHVMAEDVFQTVWYSLVAASQSVGGLSPSDALLCATAQASLFIVAKLVSILEPFLEAFFRCGDRTAAVPQGDLAS